MHRNGAICQSCDWKAATLDPELLRWWQVVRAHFPNCHISCGWRGEEEQNEAYRQKKSMRRWPDSKHNKIKNGMSASQAWDCFRLSSDGKAEFPDPDKDPFYRNIATLLENEGAPIEWAGHWGGRFRESVHFELASE